MTTKLWDWPDVSGFRPRVIGRTTGVVNLAPFRKARLAANFLRGLMHEPPWLKEVAIEVVNEQPRVVVMVTTDDPLVDRCLPRCVEGIEVRVCRCGPCRSSP